MDNEIRIKVTANTKTATRNIEKTAESVDNLAKEGERTQTRFGRLAQQLSDISPGFKKVADQWTESSEKINKRFGEGSAAAKLFKLGVIGALAAIAVKAAQVAWNFAKETAKMFNPQQYEKASSKMQNSVKKLKTAIGSFTAPVVNALMNAFSAIADGITWVLEKARIAIAYITGVLKTVFKPLIDGFAKIVSWIKNGINAIAGMLGFGAVFKDASDNAQKAADTMEGVSSELNGKLASFDKLITVDSGGGDAEEADKISDSIANAEESGKHLVKNISDFFAKFDFSNLGERFKTALSDGVKWLQTEVPKAIMNLATEAAEIPGKIKEKALEAWEGIKAKGEEVWNGIKDWAIQKWEDIKNWASDKWDDISTKANEVWTGIKDWANQKWDEITAWGQGAWDTIGTAAHNVWTGIKDWALEKWDQIKAPIEKLWNDFLSLGTDAWNGLTKLGDLFNEHVVKPIKGAVEWILNKIQWALDKISGIKDSLGNIGKGISNAVSGVVGGVKGALGLASGGAVAPNSPRPYILGDNKREYEVVSPVSLMEDTVMSALSKAGMIGGGGRSNSEPINISVEVDGKVLARAVYDPLETERRRRGTIA